jgi:hypothetical protein
MRAQVSEHEAAAAVHKHQQATDHEELDKKKQTVTTLEAAASQTTADLAKAQHDAERWHSFRRFFEFVLNGTPPGYTADPELGDLLSQLSLVPHLQAIQPLSRLLTMLLECDKPTAYVDNLVMLVQAGQRAQA